MPGPTDTARLLITRTGAWSDANARLEFSDIIWEQVQVQGDCPGPFFDGSDVSVADMSTSWTGTADNSTSQMTGTLVRADYQTPFPAIYQSTTCAVAPGYSAAMTQGSYIEPVHGTEPNLNGMTAGNDVACSFDACRDGTGDLQVILFWKNPGGSLTPVVTTFTAPLAGRYNATANIPATAETAFWRWYVASGDEVAFISRIMIEDDTQVTDDFFDGSMPPAYWTDPANPDNSTSNLDPAPLEILLPEGEYNDGLPSYSQIISNGPVTVESVTAWYYDVEPGTTLMARVNRTLRQATCTEGPTVTEQFEGNTAYLKKAEFVITCPDPWAYGQRVLAATVVNGVLTQHAPGVTMGIATPGAVNLTCYAEDVSYVPTDPNCPPMPKPPRPIPVDPCDPGPNNRGYNFFIPPTLLEELAGTYPIIVFGWKNVIQKGAQIRCWPLPKAGAALTDISACDTRGWLRVGGVPAYQGFTVDCAARTGTMNYVRVTGPSWISMPATHFIYPPPAIPATTGQTVDQIPLQWPEMYGGNDGYFIYVEQNSSVAPDITIYLDTRR